MVAIRYKVKNIGKPYAGKLHVRFDERGLGTQSSTLPTSVQKLYNAGIEVIQVDDVELSELQDSVKRLESKVDQLLTQPRKRSGFLWKEFIVGFVVVYIVMMVLSVTLGLLNQHFGFFH